MIIDITVLLKNFLDSQSFDRETNWQLLKTLVRLEEGHARGQEAVNKVEEL